MKHNRVKQIVLGLIDFTIIIAVATKIFFKVHFSKEK